MKPFQCAETLQNKCLRNKKTKTKQTKKPTLVRLQLQNKAGKGYKFQMLH